MRVFDLAYDAENDPLYYVTDLVLYKDGEQGSADEEHLVRWFGELCQALAYVHAQGIVHRAASSSRRIPRAPSSAGRG